MRHCHSMNSMKNFGKVFRIKTLQCPSMFSSSRKSSTVRRQVLCSTSDNIFHNLALEEWLYEHQDLSDMDILLMWQNKPAVVIGRHQNPWMESDVPFARGQGIDLARRMSGGGTVYHDKGNLNLSFLKERRRYDRKQNLNLVVDALTSQWEVDLHVNERDDIMLDGFYKISGTAAKLGRLKSYHHFTLLHSVDKLMLDRVLQSAMYGAHSKSTKSVPASVRNLKDAAVNTTPAGMMEVIGSHFINALRVQNNPGSLEFVHPLDEDSFPGVHTIADRLQSWPWIYGKTPNFSLSRAFTSPFLVKSSQISVDINCKVEKGAISEFYVRLKDNQLPAVEEEINKFLCSHGRFSLKPHDRDMFLEKFSSLADGSCCDSSKGEQPSPWQWLGQCLQKSFLFL